MTGPEANAKLRSLGRIVQNVTEVTEEGLVELLRHHLGIGRSPAAVRAKRYRDGKKGRDERDVRHGSSVTNDTPERDERHGQSVTNVTIPQPESCPASRVPDPERTYVPEGKELKVSEESGEKTDLPGSSVRASAREASVTNVTPVTLPTPSVTIDVLATDVALPCPADLDRRLIADGTSARVAATLGADPRDVEANLEEFREHWVLSMQPDRQWRAKWIRWVRGKHRQGELRGCARERELKRQRGGYPARPMRAAAPVQPSHGADPYANADIIRPVPATGG
jgi:hypothetical protein